MFQYSVVKRKMNHHPVSLFFKYMANLIYISMSLFPHPDYFEGNSTFV